MPPSSRRESCERELLGLGPTRPARVILEPARGDLGLSRARVTNRTSDANWASDAPPRPQPAGVGFQPAERARIPPAPEMSPLILGPGRLTSDEDRGLRCESFSDLHLLTPASEPRRYFQCCCAGDAVRLRVRVWEARAWMLSTARLWGRELAVVAQQEASAPPGVRRQAASRTPPRLRRMYCDPEPGAHVSLWWARLDMPAAALQGLAASLSTEEWRRADRFHSSRDRGQFLAARGWLRHLLASELLCAPGEVTYRQWRSREAEPPRLRPAFQRRP